MGKSSQDAKQRFLHAWIAIIFFFFWSKNIPSVVETFYLPTSLRSLHPHSPSDRGVVTSTTQKKNESLKKKCPCLCNQLYLRIIVIHVFVCRHPNLSVTLSTWLIMIMIAITEMIIHYSDLGEVTKDDDSLLSFLWRELDETQRTGDQSA